MYRTCRQETGERRDALPFPSPFSNTTSFHYTSVDNVTKVFFVVERCLFFGGGGATIHRESTYKHATINEHLTPDHLRLNSAGTRLPRQHRNLSVGIDPMKERRQLPRAPSRGFFKFAQVLDMRARPLMAHGLQG